jgi:alpha-L-arabinofuranosidase
MGLEKNSDAVSMECYAPLLVNVSPADPDKGYPRAWQWNTNLIGYDALRSFGSPSYYAQAMLAQNKGDVVLPARLGVPPAAPDAAAPHGGIGVGAWHTQVEYADISVAAPDGQKLFPADLAGDATGWVHTGGEWRAQDNAIKTMADAETWATTGDRSWTDYIVHLRARKLGGREGFLVLWHAADGDNYRWWNIGGWGNTVARCEAAESGSREPYGPGAPFSVETGRWYDLKLEVSGNRLRGFIDGKLVTDAAYQPQSANHSLFATATLARDQGTVIVKVVNAGEASVDMSINLHGATRVEPNGAALVLAGEPGAQNSVDEPRKVTPRQETIANAAPSFHRTFPPHSLTILRLRATR